MFLEESEFVVLATVENVALLLQPGRGTMFVSIESITWATGKDHANFYQWFDNVYQDGDKSRVRPIFAMYAFQLGKKSKVVAIDVAMAYLTYWSKVGNVDARRLFGELLIEYVHYHSKALVAKLPALA